MNSVKPILNTRVFKLKKNKVKTPQHKNIIFSTHSPHITPKPPEIKNYPEMKGSVAGTLRIQTYQKCHRVLKKLSTNPNA